MARRFARRHDVAGPVSAADRAHGPMTSGARAAGGRPTNLPAPLTSFIGREAETRDVRRLVRAHRLVTLTGPGGCGKTRLAFEVAAGILHEVPDGVWAVEFAGMSDPHLAGHVLSLVLGLHEAPQEDLLETILTTLESKELLLLFDNCDHVLAGVAPLGEQILQRCVAVRILATSREALGLGGEVVWSVPPLRVPPEDSPALPEAVESFEAVRLFLDRAATVTPGFVLSDDNAVAVAEICRRLDGVPLALELAAARTKVLSVHEIAQRLDDRFRLLTAGRRTADPRQQTLQATVDWSYHLLSSQEETVFRRLGVFAGTFSLLAAEAVCSGGAVERGEVLNLLSRLVDKSLVKPEPTGGETRYRLLETIRHYAIDKLRAAGEEAATRQAHRDWYLQFAEAAHERLSNVPRVTWLAEIAREHDNISAALTWMAQHHDGEDAARLALALMPFWRGAGRFTEGGRWFASVLGAGPLPKALRARVLEASGLLAVLQGDCRGAGPVYAESLQLFRDLGDRRGMASSLLWLGASKQSSGDIAGAQADTEESLSLYRDIDDQNGMGLASNRLGIIAMHQGDYARAKHLHEQTLVLRRAVGDQLGIAGSLNNLALTLMSLEEYAQAAGLFQESLDLATELGDQSGMAIALVNLGRVRQMQGQIDAATALLCDSLARFVRLEMPAGMAESLEFLGQAAATTGDPIRAARLLGAAAAQRVTVGESLEPAECVHHEEVVASLRGGLTDAVFDGAWAEGAALSPQQFLPLASIATGRETGLPQMSRPVALPWVESQEAVKILGLGVSLVYRGDRLLGSGDWTYVKGKELLFYLLSHTVRSKEQIGLALWPDASPAQLRSQFHTTLHHLRRALGHQQYVVFTGEGYAFNRRMKYWYDVEGFDRALTEATQCKDASPDEAIRQVHEAIALYRGEFLEELSDAEWCALRRQDLHRRYLGGLMLLGELTFETGRFAEAADAYRRVISHDGYFEAAHRELMRCYARMGERGQALRHFQSFVERVADELEASPDPETSRLAERLRNGESV